MASLLRRSAVDLRQVRTARWDRFGRPAEMPNTAMRIPTVWWWDAEAAGRGADDEALPANVTRRDTLGLAAGALAAAAAGRGARAGRAERPAFRPSAI